MSDGFDGAAKRAAGQEKHGLSGGLTRRRVVQGAAWSVPVIAIAAPVPAFAGASQGILTLDGTGCKLPGNANDAYKGYAFRLSGTNPRTDTAVCVRIDSVTLDGETLANATNVTVVNLATGQCANLGNPFCIGAGATLGDLAIVTKEAGNSSNGQLIVTYSLRNTGNTDACATGTCTGASGYTSAPAASTDINDVPPLTPGGGSCPYTTFSVQDRACLASLGI
jgi:hypothetical protein